MEKAAHLGVQLLLLAAEAIAEAIPGCADLLRPRAAGQTPPTLSLGGPVEAINHFGPLIIARWGQWLAAQDRDAQERAVQQLATLESATAQQTADREVERVRPAAPPEDKQAAARYLAAIPATSRSVLVPDPDTGRMVLARTTGPVDERVLLRLLPNNVPPFTAGSELPGTPYRLEELLGSGGFGVVYKASNRFEQNTPPRAIKFCLNPAMLATLHRERELLNRLMAAAAEPQWSDRVVKLYGHNLDAPVPFLVYEYVPGGSLITRLAALRKQTGQNLRPAQVLGLVRRVCEAAAFAHARGLVHRDIKPSNILVSGNRIKLADFGIGAVVAAYTAHTSQLATTHLGALPASEKSSIFRGAGTPLYMSPEQHQGESPQPHHDVYSIGVMWYQLLTGDFTRGLHPGWADELAEEYDVPQKQIDLIGLCVGYAPKRPPNAKVLLELLPPPNLPPVPSPGADRVGEVRRLNGHEGRVNALAFFRDSRRLLSAAADGTARLWDLEAGRQVGAYRPNVQSVLSVALSPDNRRALLGCDDRNAWLWDLARGPDPRCLAGHLGAVHCAAFSPDGRRAVTGGRDGSVRLWHVGSGREVLRIEEDRSPITGVAFTPDGLFILSCSEGGAFRVWDSETGWEAQQLTAEGGWLLCLAVSPDGRRAVCGGKGGLVLWGLEDAQPQGEFVGHTLPVMSVAFSPDGRWLLSGGKDKTVRLWDVASRRQVHAFENLASGVNAVAFGPDGRYAASAGDDRSVRVWALPQPERPGP
jgi:serine/threonine protein kinase